MMRNATCGSSGNVLYQLVLCSLLVFSVASANAGESAVIREELRIDVKGVERRAIVFRAQNTPLKGSPAIFALHGGTPTPLSTIADSRLDKLATKRGYVAVFPQGLKYESFGGVHAWNIGGSAVKVTGGTDDVGFLDALADRLNPSALFITGISTGGAMAAIAGNEMDYNVNAISLVVDLSPQRATVPRRPLPTLAFRGYEDLWVPYAGGKAGVPWVEHAEFQAQNRAILNGASPTPEITQLDSVDGLKLVYEGKAPVELYRLYNHGHNWPGEQSIGYEAQLKQWKSTPHGERMAKIFGVSVEELAMNNAMVSPLDASSVMLDFFDRFK